MEPHDKSPRLGCSDVRTRGPAFSLLVRLYDWLACADPVSDADLIFVLAGRQDRKVYALELYSQYRAPRLLLSVDRFEIRRFSALHSPVELDLVSTVASVSPRKRHLFVSFVGNQADTALIRPGKAGTLSEIHALAAWLKTHVEVHSVLIVSSGSHLRRIRMCCRFLLPASFPIRLLAVDKVDRLRREDWWRDRETRMIVLLEFPKLLLYWPLLHLQRIAGARTVLPGR